ncbi:MAG: IS110 family transposase [Alphaproteobacteria bacterium]
MDYYAGLDVSLEETSVCVVDGEGAVVHEVKVATEVEAIAETLQRFARSLARVGLEAGPLSPWLHGGLHGAGFAVICIETRHLKASLAAMRNKTDRNDARGMAQMMRLGWIRMVHVKSPESHALRLLLTNRKTLQRKATDIENEIRGTLKAFGLKVGKVSQRSFEKKVCELIGDQPWLGEMVRPMLTARAVLLDQFTRLHRMMLDVVRRDEVCRRFMTIQGVGPVTALTYKTGVDVPERFAKSKNVGAHFGLTPRRFSSGEIDYQGHIGKCGDAMVRTALYEAANVVLTRTTRWSALKAWAMRIAKKRGLKRARVALARKLAVIMHRMWLDGSEFRWTDEAPA